MDIKILNLEDAFSLYDLVGKHIPTIVAEDEEVIGFIEKILDSIISLGEQNVYVESISLVTGLSLDEILDLSIEETMTIFSEGLIKNHILLLCKFCRELGYG